MKLKKLILLIALSCIAVACGAASICVYAATAEEKEYYVAFGNQNYAIKNSNKLTEKDDGNYYLEKVSLSSAVDFYVTDNYGVHYYSARGENMKVDEAQTYRYNIKFSPDSVFAAEENGYVATNCHVTYAFYIPETYAVNIGETRTELTYNPYFTSYDLYYISSVRIEGGGSVSYGEETHPVTSGGLYRILFTPKVVREGNEYAFDVDGNYGSGEDYVYNLYIEDAAEYYAVFEEGADAFGSEPDLQINGKDAYALKRYENDTAAEEYRSEEVFVSVRDASLKYRIYELEITGSFRPIDDDNDEDTDVSKIVLQDAGWYCLGFIVGESGYLSSAEWCERPLDGYYIVGDFNGYGFNKGGGVDIDKKFAFAKVEDGDDDYNEDYAQYILYLTVTEDDLDDGDVEFYVTDGKDKYKNGAGYIAVNTAGEYKILFSDEHIYSQGRHYRFTLLDESAESAEIEISSAEDFLAFAEKCSESADYSVNLSAYLTCDIDFKGKSFVTVKSFGGKFYGGYHTLKNIVIDENSDCSSVFGTVARTGRIERLNIENLSINRNDGEYVGFVAENYGALVKITVSGAVSGDNYVGGIAAFNGVSRIDDNSASLDSNNVVQTGVLESCVNYASVTGKSNVGGIAGFNSGDVLSCGNMGTVTPYIRTKSNLTNIGGIAGFSAGKLSDCENRGDVGQSAYSLYVGGVAGFCTGENYFCANYGEVSGRKYVGGVIGGYGNVNQNESDRNDGYGGLNYAEIFNRYFNTGETEEEILVGARHNLIYLFNYGNVYADGYAAGVLAESNYDGLTVRNSLSTGNVTCVSGGYVGGILGNGAVTVEGCFASGVVKAGGANPNYAGGIAGNGSIVSCCMSDATVFGADYVGGIAGYISGYVFSSYSNVALVVIGDGKNVGGIAGFAESFNQSLNSFPDNFKYNYYVGDSGGICGVEYAQNFGYAAASISSEKLLSENNLSVYLHEYFDHEFWQGGESGSYPVLSYMYRCSDIADIDDEEELFAKHEEEFQAAMRESAKVTYTVVFMEWNKDEGDLYDDGEIQHGNFEEIYSVRVAEGETVQSPAPKFAELKDGKWVYEGDDAVYFVNFESVVNVAGNTVVYAEYYETASTLSDEDRSILVEGLFYKDTQIVIERTGEYYKIKFYLNGEEIEVPHYTVKFRLPDAEKQYSVYAADDSQTPVEASVYGEYIRFESDGEWFRVCENESFSLSVLEIILISVLSAVLVSAAAVVAILLIKRRKTEKRSARRD